jgi:hypothetical protein
MNEEWVSCLDGGCHGLHCSPLLLDASASFFEDNAPVFPDIIGAGAEGQGQCNGKKDPTDDGKGQGKKDVQP